MNVYKGFFVVLVFFSALFLSVSSGFAYGTYCPIPAGDSCTGCHSTPGTGGWPACPSPTTWTITASAETGGTITPSGAVSVNGGSSQLFTIAPAAGYSINNILVDGSSVGPQTSYTFLNVTANHSISVAFFQPTGSPPLADFSTLPLTSTDPYIVSFTDLSTDGPTSWLWDFGDGGKSTQQDPHHAYLIPGTYTVTLEASNSNGFDIISQNINASFTQCPNGSVDLGGWQQESIQAAYNTAIDGEVIRIQARDFNENINLNAPITVTLSGGYDCDYTINPAATILSSGTLTVSSGTLIAENLLIQSSASALDGAALYAQNCAACHGDLANSTKIPTTTTAVQSAIDTNVGNMGPLSSLTPDEVQAIVDALNAQTPPPTSCTACHGQPPSGTSSPDTAGAHTTHDTLGFGSTVPSCGACHDGAVHLNGTADLGFPSGFDAQSGPATDNLDGTCSSVKCHGGQTTPDWWSGSIDVNTDCISCHTYGTSQYNSFSSGEHNKHARDKGFLCTECHNTTKLETGHFINLESTAFELSPADTIGGGATSVPSYNGSCNLSCHGKNHNNWNW
ncbi:CxxxxCH/CxxCH domain-containing protein [Thermodesulfobacteriota bacterium]